MDEERREHRVEKEVVEAGRKGGVAAAAGVPLAETRTVVAYWSPDTIRWGPVWSGLLVTLGIYMALSAIGIGWAFGNYTASDPNYAVNAFTFLAIWSAAAMMVALFFGGWIAGRAGALLGMRMGWYQGTIVWALALVFSTLLGIVFVSGLIGGFANLSSLIAGITQASPGGAAVSPVETTSVVRAIAGAISYAAWIYLVAAIIQWAVAAIGGWIGAAGKVQTIADEVL